MKGLSMNIKKNTEMLCLRFTDVGTIDCIEEHKKLIEDIGYVWFGKIGVKPGEGKVKSILSDGIGYLILKKPDGVYICKFDEYSYISPSDYEYPSYYNDKELLGMREFSMWFRISEVKEFNDNDKLRDIVVKSSRETFMVTANKSMSSLFYVVNKKEINLSNIE